MFLVTPNYFKTVGQTLLRGRVFNDADDGRNHVAIVNRALAQHEWPGENPIGHRIFSGDLKRGRRSWAKWAMCTAIRSIAHPCRTSICQRQMDRTLR